MEPSTSDRLNASLKDIHVAAFALGLAWLCDCAHIANMEAFSSISGTTPSVGELSAEFAKQKRAKSPPLAFEKTPNDALVPLNSPRRSHSGTIDSAADTTMGRLSPLQSGEAQDLQVVVDQQASAIQLLHDAFAAERQAWSLEREQLYQRIASLETLLKTGGGYRCVFPMQLPRSIDH